jgi:uncharacterized iron-regulated membrane protein
VGTLRAWLDHPQRVALRRALFQAHLWTGLGVGLYLVVISLTGSILVFHWEIEALLAPRPVARAGPVLGYDALRDAVERTHPGGRVEGFLVPKTPTDAVQVWLEIERDGQHLIRFVDPVTGADLGPAEWNAVLQWLAGLHTNLLAGDMGLLVNGAGAACLVVLCLTGLVVWWPGVRRWRRNLRLDFGVGWKRFNWDLHGVLGVWTAIVLLIWAVTGVYYAFPQPFQATLGRVMPFEPPREAPPPAPEIPGRPFASIAAIVAAAEQATPGAVTTWIDLPHPGSGARAVIIRHERYEPWAGHSPVIAVNAYTAEVEHVDVALSGNLGDTVQRWFSYLHFGNFGGLPVKIAWTVLGLGPTVLAVTGTVMWWNRVVTRWFRRRRTESTRRGPVGRGEVQLD